MSVIAMNGLTFDLSTPHGRMMATIIAGIAEFERELRISICPIARNGGRKPKWPAKRVWSRWRRRFSRGPTPEQLARRYVAPHKGVTDASDALEGARAILIERFTEDATLIGNLREEVWLRGRLRSRVRAGKAEAGAKFSDYFEFSEPLAKLPSHRILALFRRPERGGARSGAGAGSDRGVSRPAGHL